MRDLMFRPGRVLQIAATSLTHASKSSSRLIWQMDYFRKYISGQQGAGAPTGAETVYFNQVFPSANL